ncbi:hypothetical protein PARMER_01418 [Parabacteroides merdae ATCC 43184]|nr:hypothetical protein PARMER_01418 [Parabacteroides merdae ATCC 43184]
MICSISLKRCKDTAFFITSKYFCEKVEKNFISAYMY